MAASSAISRRVRVGDSSASPRARSSIARTSSAGSVSLRTGPRAPARSVAKIRSSSSLAVSSITATPESASIRPVASTQSIPGSVASMSATSGRRRRASATASSSVDASPTTLISPPAASSARTPARSSARHRSRRCPWRWVAEGRAAVVDAAPSHLRQRSVEPAVGRPGRQPPEGRRRRRDLASCQ